MLASKEDPSTSRSSKSVNGPPKDLFVIKMKIMQQAGCPSPIHEVLYNLSNWLTIDFRQFFVISQSSPDFMGSVLVTVNSSTHCCILKHI